MYSNIPKSGAANNGDLTASLYDTTHQRSLPLHGEQPTAIDRTAVLAEWRKVWGLVLKEMTPLQRRALELEMQEGE